ncbi:thioredoxin domain-containing protein [Microbacterium pygmaeum]|uniref:Spermatogenesis-associated protein 20-like TRX domain-containing protein n=1 Tax=Microbacterium pygmaeum TaxID=370764 RepID=A0A1G7YY98_9MICO|nr:DUF255 domain-containing protein [Microbacterium pygmaeum]SDH01528.1 hypothetical protein SAMN04489810_1893 [Microbacterium pygmaeum]
MNERLENSASPYLRSHAGNPVAWFPWGEEAFAQARRRDVPVMVSIGYSTCHWCHVMARESFSDERTAAALNADFVAIKVDREEHPEVDAAYMAAASAFTQHLGWPLTVFVTPEGRPFYAGTYFPPEPRGGMPSFPQVLEAAREAWTERREQVDETAVAVVAALAEARNAPDGAGTTPDVGEIAGAASAIAAREDREYGGFGGEDPATPKFPIATALRFLQTGTVRATDPEAAAVAERALGAMAASPLRDDVEGGFFRYATRRDWTVPHYERMLTDNAQLLEIAVDAGDESTARGIAAFLTEVLQQPSGGFGAAQDSESWIDGQRSEGGFYLRDAAGRSSLDPPAVDGKVVTGWNGLAIAALARAGTRYGEPAWIESARWAADAVLGANVRPDGSLVRASLDDIASPASATLADYGQFAGGLLALTVATGEVAYALRARELVEASLERPEDPRSPIRAPGGGDAVLAGQDLSAPDAASDGDEPSGPASLADAAYVLWLLGGGDRWRALAEQTVAAHAASALSQPLAYGALLRTAARLARPPRQLVVVSERPEALLVTTARAIPADIVTIVTAEQAHDLALAGFELFEGKLERGGAPTAYDCVRFACRLPVTDPAGLAA